LYLPDYIKYQKSIGSKDVSVEAVQLSVTKEEITKMKKNLNDRFAENGTTAWGGTVCSIVSSQFLKDTIKIAPEKSRMPGNLHDDLIDDGHQGW